MQALIQKHKNTQEKLSELLELSRRINNSGDLHSLLLLIAKEASDLLKAEKASVFIFDREKNELWSIVSLDGEQIRFDARLGIAGASVTTGKTINVKDAYDDPRFYKRIDEQSGGSRTRSILIVPLKGRDGNVLGTFQVINKKKGTFDKPDIEILEILAQSLTNSIEKFTLIDELRERISQLESENIQLRNDVHKTFSTQNIIGENPKIQNIVRLIEQLSDTSLNVLITGESGTGKELIAKALHFNSPRSGQPFIAINCAAIPENLIESLLFGIEKGVATGVEQRIGKFEEANRGTLFMDEIGDLSYEAQAKILRVLQEGIVQHVGGSKSIPIDVRIIAATNKNLKNEIAKNKFREDLYYRLKVVEITTPPLREIKQDIPLFANYFLARYCEEMKKETKTLTPDAMSCFISYSWPGNVRELENTIKRLIAILNKKTIKVEDLPQTLKELKQSQNQTRLMSTRTLQERVEEIERDTIIEALELCQNNQKQAAKLLGLSRQGLINKIKRYGI